MNGNEEFYRKQTQNQHEKFIVKFADEEINKPPSRYYIVDAFNHLVFVKVRERHKAQEIVDEIYGKGFYKVRYMGLQPLGSKEVSAK